MTLYILGTLVFEVSFGLIMAVLLNSDRPRLCAAARLVLLAGGASMSAAGVLWTFVFDYRTGLINAVLKGIGLGRLGAALAVAAGDRAALRHAGLGLEIRRLLHDPVLCRAAPHSAQSL